MAAVANTNSLKKYNDNLSSITRIHKNTNKCDTKHPNVHY